eukprot:Pgem_evm1s17997
MAMDLKNENRSMGLLENLNLYPTANAKPTATSKSNHLSFVPAKTLSIFVGTWNV